MMKQPGLSRALIHAEAANMQDPCDPPPHHVHTVTHHHPMAHVIGRIRRHGTARIAQRLHAIAGGCPAGPPLVLGGATLKAVLPAVAFVGLTTLASSVTVPADPQADEGFAAGGGLGYGVGGTTGSVGVPPHKHVSHHHPPVSVPEPPSFALLLLAIVGWLGIRFGSVRGPARGKRQGKHSFFEKKEQKTFIT